MGVDSDGSFTSLSRSHAFDCCDFFVSVSLGVLFDEDVPTLLDTVLPTVLTTVLPTFLTTSLLPRFFA